MSEDDKLDRREFLQRAGMIGAAVVGGSQFLSACDKGGGGSQKGQSGSGGQQGGGEGAGELDCTDTSGLSESEIKTRESLKYVDETPKPDKTCDNCRLYEKPESEGKCGGCTVVPGPVHPKGYCNSWQKMKG